MVTKIEKEIVDTATAIDDMQAIIDAPDPIVEDPMDVPSEPTPAGVYNQNALDNMDDPIPPTIPGEVPEDPITN